MAHTVHLYHIMFISGTLVGGARYWVGVRFITTWGGVSKLALLSLGGAAVREMGPGGASRAIVMGKELGRHIARVGTSTIRAGLPGDANAALRHQLINEINNTEVDGSGAGVCSFPPYLRDQMHVHHVWRSWPSLIVLAKR